MTHRNYEAFNEGTARFYLWFLDRLGLLRWAYAMAMDVVLSNVKTPAKILEIGSGTGRLAQMLSERGFHVVGIDISMPMVKRAIRFWRPDFINGASWALPLRNEYFDVVIAQFTLHHWGDHVNSMAMVYSVLKVGGLFIVIEADGDRISVIRDHSCTEDCLRKVIPSSSFELSITRRYPLIIAIARKVVQPIQGAR